MSITICSILAFILLSMSSSIAQQKYYSVTQQKETVVQVQDLAALDVSRAKLSNVIARNDGKYEERFELSFQVPNTVETTLDQTQIMLTAYKSDGSVYGKQIWRSSLMGTVDKLKEGTRVTLHTDPKLDGANSYKLGLTTSNARNKVAGEATSCEQCVNYASNTCGSSGVGSVTCGGDGGCSFTCR